MRVVMRTDAASHIGIGHVMRCLTLANALKEKGAEVSFVCRPFAGHQGERIIAEGHQLHMLPIVKQAIKPIDPLQIPHHAPWLGESWETDLAQTQVTLKDKYFDWMIVDHYSLDARWESIMREFTRKVMVIDDLADRLHDCDLLLDQTYGRSEEAYKSKVPENCTFLTGSKYALLRPEFLALREFSLNRRKNPQIKHLLVTFGGVDRRNSTSKVLEVLKESPLPRDCRITVVLGAIPSLEIVRKTAKTLPWPIEVLFNVSQMAQIMASSDLCIGAAGSTSWERCCLGLPTLMTVLGENQQYIGRALEEKQAAILFDDISDIKESIGVLCKHPEKLDAMSQASSRVTDGSGLKNVVKHMEHACV